MSRDKITTALYYAALILYGSYAATMLVIGLYMLITWNAPPW